MTSVGMTQGGQQKDTNIWVHSIEVTDRVPRSQSQKKLACSGGNVHPGRTGGNGGRARKNHKPRVQGQDCARKQTTKIRKKILEPNTPKNSPGSATIRVLGGNRQKSPEAHMQTGGRIKRRTKKKKDNRWVTAQPRKPTAPGGSPRVGR